MRGRCHVLIWYESILYGESIEWLITARRFKEQRDECVLLYWVIMMLVDQVRGTSASQDNA